MCIVCCLLGYSSSDIDLSFCLGSKYVTGLGLYEKEYGSNGRACLFLLLLFLLRNSTI